MNKNIYNLIISSLSVVMALIVLIVLSFAWYTANKDVNIGKMELQTSGDGYTAEIKYYEANLTNNIVTYTKANEYKTPATMPLYDPLLSVSENNCLVVEIILKAEEVVKNLELDIICGTDTYSTAYPTSKVSNFCSNIVNFCDLANPTISGNSYTHNIGSNVNRFIQFAEDGITPIAKKNTKFSYDVNALLTVNSYYFVIFYNDASLNYFYSQNLDRADSAGLNALIFKNDISFLVKEAL